MKIHITKLGCARNQVDAEIMAGTLVNAGHKMVATPNLADVLVVNTCSFIETAAQESVNTILELADLKASGLCKRIIVTSCLPQRYGQSIKDALPEVDCFLGTAAFDQIEKAVNGEFLSGSVILIAPELAKIEDVAPQARDNETVAYLKIAEGCSRHCTYCIIPKLRGKQRSRRVASIVADAKAAIARGAKELVLVAQDSTAYGDDLGQDAPDLGDLLTALGTLTQNMPVADKPWIRVLYGHPESLGASFLEAAQKFPNIAPYFDLPVQHISPLVLRKMGRAYNADALYALFDKIRCAIPHAVLRTTLIVGFPGETPKDVKLLENFVRNVRFEHLGVFTYSNGDDLASHNLPNHVTERTAKARLGKIMQLQKAISEDYLQGYIGQTLTVLIEEEAEEGIWLGRTIYQAPEVDGIVYVHVNDVNVDFTGAFVPVTITDALEYDLIGTM